TNAVRYSFRADEWERSLVADALLRSDVAFANEFFFARMLDPTGVENTPRRVAIGANHGGEFIDLLQTVPSRTTMLRADGTTLALLTDLAGGPPRQTVSYAQDAFTTAWSTVLHGKAITYRQTIVVTRDSSTLELRASLTIGLQVLQPAELVNRYDVGAVLLPRDAVFDARKSRLGRLGFRVADSVGPYTILVRS